MSHSLRWALLLLVIPSTGCFSPDLSITDCKIPCDPGPCPSGSECRAGFCVQPGSTATCNGRSAADAGGAADGSVGSGGSAGTVGSGGSVGTAGSGGSTDVHTDAAMPPTIPRDATVADSSPPPPDAPSFHPASSTGIAIAVVAPAALCGERGASIPITASGGEPPYHWRLTQAPAGWAVDPEGATAALTTSLVQGGGDVTIVIRLTDSAGRSVERPVNLPVRDVPRVTTTMLPGACATLPYGYEFTAAGGDPTSYRWRLLGTNGSDGAFDGDVLTVTPPDTDLEVTVQVADDSCSSDPAALTVHVDPNVDQCPMIDPPGLPPPCKDNPYPAVQLTAEGGTGALTWRALALPDGMKFDPTDQSVSGTPTTAGASTFDVEVVDGAGRRARGSFPTTVRNHCWFAYVAQSGGAADLYRFDPYLLTTQTVSHTPSGASGVDDFAFSPDGRYLVYRTRDTSGNAALVVADAESWREHAVDFPGTVLAYAWASDSRTVAVAGKAGNNTWLSGFSVSSSPSEPDGGTSPDAGAATTTVVEFAKAVAPLAPGAAFSSELIWIGPSTLVFHAGIAGGTNTGAARAYYSHLRQSAGSVAPDGFDTPVELDQTAFTPAMRMQASDGGFFAFDPTVSAPLYFFRFGNQVDFYPFPPGVADPNGVYSANVDGDALDLHRAAGIVPPAGGPPWAQAAGCTSILAWAFGRDRIVCDAPAGQAAVAAPLRVFDVDSSNGTLNGADLREATGYSPGTSIERRRLLSPSGNWFAFTTDALVYVADTGDATPHLAKSFTVNPKPPSSSTYTQLSFSPNEQLLLAQRGNVARVQRLDDIKGSSQPMSTVLRDVSAPCTEDFTADPSTWCGSATNTSSFRWSNDSLVAAARTANGHITWWNFSDISDSVINYDDVCTTGCTDDYGFQP